MMSRGRRDILTRTSAIALAAAVPLLGLPRRSVAQGAELTMKFANNLPVTHRLNVRAAEIADAIRDETRGRVDLNVFPNNRLARRRWRRCKSSLRIRRQQRRAELPRATRGDLNAA